MEITYKDAIERVRAELLADPQLFYAFQANIAMPICDALSQADVIKPGSYEHIHELANKGAVNFLTLLCEADPIQPPSALGRISKERWKQIYRYGYDPMHDDYADGELLQAALFCIDPTGDFDHLWPKGWGKDARQRILDRSTIDQLTVAASFVAAHIDRLLYLKGIENGPRTLDQCVNRYLNRFKKLPDSLLEKGEDYFSSYCHSQLSGGIGMQIRNELGLWVQDSPLHQYFLAEHNLFEPDAMSDLILRHIYRELIKPQQQFSFEGKNWLRVTITAPSLAEAVASFKRDYPGAEIDAIDERELIATCIYSGLPIFEDDDYVYGGEYWLRAHGPTPEEMAEEARTNPTTDDND